MNESMIERIRMQSGQAKEFSPETVVVTLTVIESIVKDYKDKE
jgi:hypothetical protein